MAGSAKPGSIAIPVPSTDELRRSLARWLKDVRVDLALLAALTVVAIVLRVVQLGDLPPGLRG
jgi:hypothetical protein